MSRLLVLFFGCTASLMASLDVNEPMRLRLRDSVIRHLPEGSAMTWTSLQSSRLLSASADCRLTTPDLPAKLVSFSCSDSQGTIGVLGKANWSQRVVVLKKTVVHNQVLTASDLGTETRDLSLVGFTMPFASISDVVGRRVRGWLRPSAVLTASNTLPAILVHAAQSVTLSRRIGSLVLSAQVEALSEGSENQWILVSNPKTRKRFKARVTGVGRVSLQ